MRKSERKGEVICNSFTSGEQWYFEGNKKLGDVYTNPSSCLFCGKTNTNLSKISLSYNSSTVRTCDITLLSLVPKEKFKNEGRTS